MFAKRLLNWQPIRVRKLACSPLLVFWVVIFITSSEEFRSKQSKNEKLVEYLNELRFCLLKFGRVF